MLAQQKIPQIMIDNPGSIRDFYRSFMFIKNVIFVKVLFRPICELDIRFAYILLFRNISIASSIDTVIYYVHFKINGVSCRLIG